MLDLTEIKSFYQTRNFDVLKINYHIENMDTIRDMVTTILQSYPTVLKDGYKTYEALGLQYNDDQNQLYDAVQQTAFINDKDNKGYRIPQHYREKNDIGKMFQFVYDKFSEVGISLERGRILKAVSGHRHNNHFDYDIRIHLPVFTNSECKMVYGDNTYHMDADGYLYLINGFRLHHFYNAGETDRVHLVWLVEPNELRTVEHHKGTGIGDLLTVEEGRERLAQYARTQRPNEN